MSRQPSKGIAGLWRRLTRRLGRSLYLDLGGAGATLLVAGSGRSGTTWLAEVLNHDNAYRYLFEPLHPAERESRRLLPPRLYARPGSRPPAVVSAVEAVMTGRIRDPWTDQYNLRLVATRRLVKEVWQNLLLGWVRQEYPEVRIALILRHPCAVADSQVQTGWDWRVDPGSFLSQPDLMDDHLEPYRVLLSSTEDPFERHLLTWCVENLVPLRQLAPATAYLAFYEHLRTDPWRELPPLFGFCGRPWDPSVIDRLAKPSALARSDWSPGEGHSPVGAWRSRVSPERMARAADLLATFGLDRLYDVRDPMPRIRGEEVLSAFSTA